MTIAVPARTPDAMTPDAMTPGRGDAGRGDRRTMTAGMR